MEKISYIGCVVYDLETGFAYAMRDEVLVRTPLAIVGADSDELRFSANMQDWEVVPPNIHYAEFYRRLTDTFQTGFDLHLGYQSDFAE